MRSRQARRTNHSARTSRADRDVRQRRRFDQRIVNAVRDHRGEQIVPGREVPVQPGVADAGTKGDPNEASKATLWSATDAMRLLLQGRRTQVVGLLVGTIDTPGTARWDVPKVSVESVATRGLRRIADGLIEILADDSTPELKSQMSAPAEVFYPQTHEMLAGFVA